MLRFFIALAALVLLPAPALAAVPMPVYPDCGNGGACPQEFHPWHKWDLSSTQPDELPPGQIPADEVPLGSGLWADKAWSLTTGRTDVLIAVLDSGIEWDSGQILKKHYIHTPELPLPQNAAGTCASYDCNGDGVVNIDDWAADPRVDPASGINATSHPDSVLDPSDLIAAFSDGVDDDGNGYIDDISGWDFFWNDNNPYDDTRYGHGTGEAKDSAAEGDGGGGDIGVCPNCMVLSLRVGDSFVADTNNFGNAATYAVDMGASVIQEALGVLNNTPLTVAAIEYAWERGVTVIASAADETAYHQNYPANNHHTVYTHAVRYDSDDRIDTRTWFAYSNCTNYGGRLVLSAPSTSCSSGAVGVTSGLTGLVYSAMKDQLESGDLSSPLTSNEVLQILAQTTDDIAFVPEDHHPDLYPSYPGWDRYFGYGRVNAWRAVQAVYDGAIPPEADLLTPEWFEVLDLGKSTSLDVEGYAASRFGSYTWELQVAAGLDPRQGTWTTLASGSGDMPTSGLLATIDLTEVPVDPDAVIPAYVPEDDNVDKTNKAFTHAATLRLQVTDAAGRLGEMRKTLFVQRDPDLLPGFPKRPARAVDGSPTLVDVDGDGVDDVVWVGSEGAVHVGDATLADKPGWPQQAPLIDEHDPAHPENHVAAPGFSSGDVPPEQRHAILATPAVADLDGDGQIEVVVGTLNGAVLAWHADGTVVAGFPFWLDEDLVRGHTNTTDLWDYGFFASPALGDLDGDGDLEIVLGAMDSRVYALHHDGSAVAGFPVELRLTYDTADGPRSNGERIVSSPALGDADGDGDLEIAIGTNQKTTGTYGAAYLLHHDGSIVDGWPVLLFGAYTNALPYVGEGVPGAPTMCDIDGDGDVEIAVHTIADSGKLFGGDGVSVGNLARVEPDFGSGSNTDEPAANLIMINSGAWGDVDADGVPDYAIGSVGFEYANGLLDDGQRFDHDHLLSVWSGAPEDGKFPFLRGFPQVMEDLQFFLNPGIADIDGDGWPEVINASAGHLVHAFNRRGEEPVGWPKNAGQWILGSPAVGDADGDGFLEVWTATRSGYVYAWRTTTLAAVGYRGWTGFRHDPMNTGNCLTPLRTYPLIPPVELPVECGCGSSVGGRAGLLGALGLLLLGLVRRSSRGSGRS